MNHFLAKFDIELNQIGYRTPLNDIDFFKQQRCKWVKVAQKMVIDCLRLSTEEGNTSMMLLLYFVFFHNLTLKVCQILLSPICL